MNIEDSIDAGFAVKSNLSLLRPYDLVGARKIRVGRPFDGGYIMVDSFDGIDAAYSFGINDDVSWDVEVANRDIDIFQYDHTIENLPDHHPRFTWRKVGIAPFSAENMTNIQDILVDTGHIESTELILKCDIECHEWEVLRHTPKHILSKFRQIVLELHDLRRLGDPGNLGARQALLNLTNSHKVVHVHANNHAGVSVVGGVPLPDVIELTLVRNDAGEFTPSKNIYPTPMDMPCKSTRADIFLGSFVFS